MEEKIIKEPVYKTVQTGSRDKIKYVAVDGKEFNNVGDCQMYESCLESIEKGKDQFVDIKINKLEDILSILFEEAIDTSSIRVFGWTATKDDTKINIAFDYLKAKGCEGLYTTELNNDKFNEGDKIIIFSWISFDHSDYPKYYTKAIKHEDAMKIIENLVSEMETIFSSI